jgi:hypothetical protein
MENKGISAAGLIVIVVIVAAAGVGGYLLLGGSGGGVPGGLPEYPGAQGYDLSEYEALLPSGVEFKAYTTSASVSEIMTWYKGHMSSGWTYDNTNSSEANGLLIYTKGDDAAEIYAFGGEYYGAGDVTIIALVVGPTDTVIGT